MAAKLIAAQRKQRHEIADVQAVRGWVEAGVNHPRACGEVLCEPIAIRDLGQQPPLVELVYQRAGHGIHPPNRGAPYQNPVQLALGSSSHALILGLFNAAEIPILNHLGKRTQKSGVSFEFKKTFIKRLS